MYTIISRLVLEATYRNTQYDILWVLGGEVRHLSPEAKAHLRSFFGDSAGGGLSPKNILDAWQALQ